MDNSQWKGGRVLVCRGGAREEESRERPQEGGNSIVVSAYFPSPLRLDITGHTTAFVRPLPHTQIKKKIYIYPFTPSQEGMQREKLRGLDRTCQRL